MEELPQAGDPRTVQTPGWLEEPILGVAETRIDKIAKVIKLVTSLSSSNRTLALGACALETNPGVAKDYQLSDATPSR